MDYLQSEEYKDNIVMVSPKKELKRESDQTDQTEQTEQMESEVTEHSYRSKYRENNRYNRNTRRSKQAQKNVRTKRTIRTKGLQEKILLQFIFTGIVLAGILSLNIIKNDTTANIRSDVISYISYDTTLEDVKLSFDKAASFATSLSNSVKSALGLETDDDWENNSDTIYNTNNDSSDNNALNSDYLNIEALEALETLDSEDLDETLNSENIPLYGERIDEDILEELNNKIDLYNIEK